MDIAGMVLWVRRQIRDTCPYPTQAFLDVIDNTLATPAVVANNSPELIQFINAALGEYSRYRSLRKPYTLELVAGTTEYDLPDDWMRADLAAFNDVARPQELLALLEAQPYLQVAGPLGVLPSTLTFEWYDQSRQVVLSTEPLADYSLAFSYFAVHTPETVPAQDIDAALSPAVERALFAIATDQSVKLQSYKIANNITIDNRKIAEHLLDQAKEWRDRFLCDIIRRPVGLMGRSDPNVYW